MSKKELIITLTREGDSLKEKTVIGEVPIEVTMKLNETFEWKEKEENPVYHVKVRKKSAPTMLREKLSGEKEENTVYHVKVRIKQATTKQSL